MMAESTGGMTLSKAEDYGSDIDLLAQNGALKEINVMLFSAGVKKYAVRYTINTESGEMESSRPGGVIWPRLPSPDLRVVISYAPGGNAIKNELIQRGQLNISWSPSSEDITHSTLSCNGGRNYNSNGYGLNRTDFS